jgi:hypothetical protein
VEVLLFPCFREVCTVTFFWAFMLAGAFYSLVESDQNKLDDWHKRGRTHVLFDRAVSAPLLVFALWRIYLIWCVR